MRSDGERISCLMVTQPCAERFELFRRSVACFLAQTHEDRELVVVLDNEPAEWVEKFTAQLVGLPAKVVTVPGRKPLGALRNLSIDAASGSYLCQWDDDDVSHPLRLAAQLAALRAGTGIAVVLDEVMHLFTAVREVYWELHRHTQVGCFPGSILFRHGLPVRYPEEGPACRKGEDTIFVFRLREVGEVVKLPEMPHLYVYVYHGGNTYEIEHHRNLAQRLSLSRAKLLRQRTLVEQLAGLDLGEGLVEVMGNNGPAFQLPGRRPTLGGNA